MRVRMLKTVHGSENGSVTRLYEKGEVYDLGHDVGARALAVVFLAEGWGEDADGAAPAPVPVAAPEVERDLVPPPKAGKRGRG